MKISDMLKDAKMTCTEILKHKDHSRAAFMLNKAGLKTPVDAIMCTTCGCGTELAGKRDDVAWDSRIASVKFLENLGI